MANSGTVHCINCGFITVKLALALPEKRTSVTLWKLDPGIFICVPVAPDWGAKELTVMFG